MPEMSPERAGGGRFRRGVSGNPGGRPKGTRALLVQGLDQIAADDIGDVIRAMVTAAKAGDAACARIVLARAWPVRAGRPMVLDLPTVATPEQAPMLTARLLQAVAEGQLSAEEAEPLSRLIAAHLTALQTHDLAARLSTLEAQAGQSRPPQLRAAA